MTRFRYQAIEGNGASVKGVIEAEDRQSAIHLLSGRGLFPSELEVCSQNGNGQTRAGALPAEAPDDKSRPKLKFGSGVKRKVLTAFTREIASLLGAGIPILQALQGLGQEEENPALKEIILSVSESVRKGAAIASAMEEHPKLFNRLYVSMVRVGEEAGALSKVMNDLADLLEHEDEVRGEVVAAISYPAFVLAFGFFTVTILLSVVLPRLFTMLQEMLPVLPLPTLVLLKTSGMLQQYWPWILVGLIAAVSGAHWYLRTPAGALLWDRIKLRMPLVGPVFQAAALSRFARTLGTLVKAGVSLLPALRIVENTIGNLMLSNLIARVSEETRGGDSLATPLRKLGIFPNTVIQMVGVGEETGKLDEMLLKVAEIEERHMRARTKTLVSLLAPALILIVGAIVGFMVIAILLPIFKMSRAIH